MANAVAKLSRNPCRYCVAAVVYNGKHMPNYKVECQQCENKKAHKAYLQSQRMFEAGEPITSMEELLQQQWVIWHGATKHIEIFRSMTLRTVEGILKRRSIRKAIRKEKD